MNYDIFINIPPQIGTLLLAMLPIGELRGSIPFALTVYKMGVWESYFWSVIGNMLPVAFLIVGLEKVSQFLIKRSPLAEKFFAWLFARTRKKFTGNFEKWGEFALVLFVAIPLPVTGAWTASMAAYLFGIPLKKAMFFIFLGVLIAGIVVTTLTLGATSFLAAL